jgi:hypothetical protein
MSLTELVARCDDCLQWLHGDEVKGLAWVYLTGDGDRGARPRIRQQLVSLLQAAADAAGEPPVTGDEVLQATLPRMPKALGVLTATRLVKRLRAWAVAPDLPGPGTGEQPARPRGAAGAAWSANSEVSLDSRALAVFIEHRDWTKKRIAEHLGCHEKSLAPNRCPKLARAVAASNAPIDPGRPPLRGSKDSDGTLEAWEKGE